MNDLSSGFDPVDDLVEGFLERLRRGERPALTEYTDKHPELAERIPALFPALLVMEEIGSRPGVSSGSLENRTGSAARMPERLGDYLLLRRIGSGGIKALCTGLPIAPTANGWPPAETTALSGFGTP